MEAIDEKKKTERKLKKAKKMSQWDSNSQPLSL